MYGDFIYDVLNYNWVPWAMSLDDFMISKDILGFSILASWDWDLYTFIPMRWGIIEFGDSSIIEFWIILFENVLCLPFWREFVLMFLLLRRYGSWKPCRHFGMSPMIWGLFYMIHLLLDDCVISFRDICYTL